MERVVIKSKDLTTGVCSQDGVSFTSTFHFEIPVGTTYPKCLKDFNSLVEGMREHVKDAFNDDRTRAARAIEPKCREQLAAAKDAYVLKLEELREAVQRSEPAQALCDEVHALGGVYMHRLQILHVAMDPAYPRVKKIIAAAGTPACTPTPPQTAAR